MLEVFEKLQQLLEQKKASVLVTVVQSSGSTPRSKNAYMLMSKDGYQAGTIGGGMVEFRAQEIAREVLESEVNRLEKFILAPNKVADLGMICGGNVEVFFQYIAGNDQNTYQICQKVTTAASANEQCWLILKLAEQELTSLALYSDTPDFSEIDAELKTELLFNKQGKLEDVADERYFVEPLIHLGKVYIFGGGHVGQALVPILKYVDFHCVIADDRADFLTEELFPAADERVLLNLSKIAENITITADDYVVVVTRGHRFDYEVETQMLQTAAKYIGVMGSKTKAATHVKKLRDAGFSQTEIGRLHMPIGLKIGAETPAELAICIAGELIAERAKDE